eukprot:scaffold9778_cov15-Tisochrysis_lutea.AAC.1
MGQVQLNAVSPGRGTAPPTSTGLLVEIVQDLQLTALEPGERHHGCSSRSIRQAGALWQSSSVHVP